MMRVVHESRIFQFLALRRPRAAASLEDFYLRRTRVRRVLLLEHELVPMIHGQIHARTGLELTREHALGERAFDGTLNDLAQRPRAHFAVERAPRQSHKRLRREGERHFALGENGLRELVEHEVRDFGHGLFAERVKDDFFVNAIPQLGREHALGVAERERIAVDFSRRIEANLRRAHELPGAGVGSENDDCVDKAHGAAFAVGQATVVENLQQDVLHIGVRFFEFVEQDDLERALAHRFGQLTALAKANVTRR